MKKILLFILNVFMVGLLFGQGIVKEKQVITSKILNRDVHFSIYLPSDYNTSERSYPVTYLLHGYGDADDGWIQFGEINRLADKAITDVGAGVEFVHRSRYAQLRNLWGAGHRQ